MPKHGGSQADNSSRISGVRGVIVLACTASRARPPGLYMMVVVGGWAGYRKWLALCIRWYVRSQMREMMMCTLVEFMCFSLLVAVGLYNNSACVCVCEC